MATQRSLTEYTIGPGKNLAVHITLTETAGYDGTVTRTIPRTATALYTAAAAVVQSAVAAAQGVLGEYSAGDLARDLTQLRVVVLPASVEVYVTAVYDDAYGLKATQTRRIPDTTTEANASALADNIITAAQSALGWTMGRG